MQVGGPGRGIELPVWGILRAGECGVRALLEQPVGSRSEGCSRGCTSIADSVPSTSGLWLEEDPPG